MTDTNLATVVTGAGGGIGSALARELARPDVKLALLDRRADLLHEIAAECEALGADVVVLGADQTSPEAVAEAIDSVVDEHGGIGGLFANAGYGRFSSFLEQPHDEWRRHLDINLTGTFFVCQAVARVMVRQRQGGAIVVNASSGAIQHTDLLSAYCTTKAGLAMLVMGMASELGPHRIRVNAVLPGATETGMTAPMLDGAADHRGGIRRATPAGRLGRPEDIARAVRFLLSPQSDYITGQSIAVDGGQTIHGHPQWFRTDFSSDFSEEWVPAT